ncbi:hypothetical protein GCM10011344_26790 [Dokdonia pacifica]|uniref:Uncharacterized protein n=1 Tax=Dokdonia pacifica TaxID=1627892 RepID=A0A239E154_9FLAO|nr:hypothetical protein [Dokdonia pacifica]GGG24749.1 hypothetical protein GCM10011344_26790 [Dokdonia pacifica]SNS37712.1 hypothetical protein SAMN06265376_11317 [Dokdonia pacifica]
MFTLLLTQYRRGRQLESLGDYILESNVFWMIVILAITFILIKRTRKEYHSHWNTLLDECKLSSRDFYAELKSELARTSISGMNNYNVYLKEGSIFSGRRLYLRVNWKNYRYDICAAPFGKGFFISSWLLNKTGIIEYFISRFPLGLKIVKMLNPVTYYKIDTASMFQTYCHQAVLNVIDRMTKDTGVRPLSEDQKKPVFNHNNLFKR